MGKIQLNKEIEMQFHLEQQTNTKKIPRWFAKFILRQTQNNPNIQQIVFTLVEPMTPQEWCLIWIPVIHPGIELPCDGERNHTGYMKACLTTLSTLTGYHERTVEGWFYGKPYHYSVEILLRCFHLIFKLQQYLN
ncbi:hypothetical protein CK510_11130 [Brunnivagina elsteri CCALA 953]|uniref:Uncharacterized protein n=2 Tax=Brunnivagina TaxID=3344733 RepID=A0A2A2TJN2_9CYAN|nr:hypothetical protein [Calothrix elsteri]PAX55221.1 hypothetical protein CK510_11130 [Calothrix elsteri CCALA 953]